MTLAVFTDLDGTLLDHDSYSFAAAEPALAALKKRAIPLVLASSKTALEMADLHAALGLGHTPAIVENGAGLYRPEQGPAENDRDYRRIRSILKGGAAPFEGFGDMTPARIAEVTGLSPVAAKAASARCFSEPGLWHGTQSEKEAFLLALAKAGITARDGGRFLTLSFGRTKADAMRAVANDIGATTTIALGDAPNDREMLEAADFAVIVRNDHGPDLTVTKPTDRLIRTAAQGPAGWNDALLSLLDRL